MTLDNRFGKKWEQCNATTRKDINYVMDPCFRFQNCHDTCPPSTHYANPDSGCLIPSPVLMTRGGTSLIPGWRDIYGKPSKGKDKCDCDVMNCEPCPKPCSLPKEPCNGKWIQSVPKTACECEWKCGPCDPCPRTLLGPEGSACGIGPKSLSVRGKIKIIKGSTPCSCPYESCVPLTFTDLLLTTNKYKLIAGSAIALLVIYFGISKISS